MGKKKVQAAKQAKKDAKGSRKPMAKPKKEPKMRALKTFAAPKAMAEGAAKAAANRPAKAKAAPAAQKPKKAAKEMDVDGVDAFLAGDSAPASKPKKAKGKKAPKEAAVDPDHQKELDAIQKQDPEFYKFLQENDSGLLAFGGDDDDDDDEAGDDAEDADDADEGDAEMASEDDGEDDGEFAASDDSDAEPVFEGDAPAAADDEDDADDGDDVAKGRGGSVLTRAKFDALKESISSGHSLRSLKRLVVLLRCACSVEETDVKAAIKKKKKDAKHAQQDDDEDEDAEAEEEDEEDDDDDDDDDEAGSRKAYEILDSDVRRDVIEFGLSELDARFRSALGGDASGGATKPATAAQLVDSAGDKWASKVMPLVRSVLNAILEALKSGVRKDAASQLQLLVVVHLQSYTAWLTVKPLSVRTAPKYVRTLVALFARTIDGVGDDDDAQRAADVEALQKLQVESYLRLRELVRAERSAPGFDAGHDDSTQELALRKAYNAYARDVGPSLSKAVYAKRRYSSVAFVASCIAELYGDADAAIGYRCAFVYVRQLALGVRAALANRDAKQVEKVLCWRFLNAAKCWTSVLARGSNGRADRFGPLVFPLCQVLFGAIELAQSPKHAPLRLHCCKALHTIAGAAEVYVPTTAALLQTLEESKAARTSQPAKKGKSKDDLGDAAQQVQLLCSLNDDQMKLRAVRDEVAKYTCDLLGDYLELLRYSPAVPELSLVPMVALKAASRDQSASPALKAGARAALTLFEAAADDVEKRRATLTVAPKDVVDFEPLLPPNAPAAKQRLAARQRDRARRRARLATLSDSAQDVSTGAKQGPAKPKAKAAPKPKPAAKAPAQHAGGTGDDVMAFALDDFLG